MDLEFLSSVSIFSDLSDSELDNITTLCQTRKYPKKDENYSAIEDYRLTAKKAKLELLKKEEK